MFEAVVIGTSAGGIQALKEVLPALPADFPLPIAIVQHVSRDSTSYTPEYLDNHSAIHVKEAEDKEYMVPGTAYMAPPGYHLLIEPDRSFSLSVDPSVNFSCPAIDVLFESAADILGPRAIGVVLTGANSDGSAGLKAISDKGGTTIVQDPETALAQTMPQSAIDLVSPDHITTLEELPALLVRLADTPVIL